MVYADEQLSLQASAPLQSNFRSDTPGFQAAAAGYRTLVDQLNEQRTFRDEYIQITTEKLRDVFAAHEVSADVTGRAKHLYSIYKKLLRPEVNMDLSRVYDLYAVRVLVDTMPGSAAAS